MAQTGKGLVSMARVNILHEAVHGPRRVNAFPVLKRGRFLDGAACEQVAQVAELVRCRLHALQRLELARQVRKGLRRCSDYDRQQSSY